MNGAVDTNTVLVVLLGLLDALLLSSSRHRLESGHVLELRTVECGGSAGLEGTSQEQLRRQQWSELHVEGRAGRGQIGAICGMLLVVVLVVMLVMLLLGLLGLLSDRLHWLRINGRNIPAPRMPVSKAGDVRSEGAVGKARVAVRGLGRMAREAVPLDGGTGPGRTDGARELVLHPEKMRRDKTVPGDVR